MPGSAARKKEKAETLPTFGLRELKEEDDDEVRALFHKVFGYERKAEVWNWRYRDNPFHPPVRIVATSGSHVLGHQAVTPVFLNLKGDRVLSAQSGDTMVDPTARRLGIFQKALDLCHRKSDAEDFALIYGFPGPLSLAGFLHKGGWARICPLQEYNRRLSLQGPLRRWLRLAPLAKWTDGLFRLREKLKCQRFLRRAGRLVGSVRYETSDLVPSDYDAFWKKMARAEVYGVWKDHAYFTWRYDQNPAHRYHYHCLRRDGQIVALAVTRAEGEVISVVELMVLDNAVAVGRKLVGEIWREAFAREQAHLRFIGHDDGFFSDVFQSFRHRQLHDDVFCLFPLKAAKPYPGIELAGNWTITHGDWDNG